MGRRSRQSGAEGEAGALGMPAPLAAPIVFSFLLPLALAAGFYTTNHAKCG
jgi:hypothetical protein